MDGSSIPAVAETVTKVLSGIETIGEIVASLQDLPELTDEQRETLMNAWADVEEARLLVGEGLGA